MQGRISPPGGMRGKLDTGFIAERQAVKPSHFHALVLFV
jgi:hypothetical protein